jgi:hypothetical protein
MTESQPTPTSWPEPPGCPSCKAPNLEGSATCWICGAELPASQGPAPPTPSSADLPAGEPAPGSKEGGEARGGAWPRPRLTLGTTMLGVAVVAVFLAVGQGRAGVPIGLALIVGPSVGYLVARVRRISRGEEEPSGAERVLGELAATILAISASAAVLAALVLLGMSIARAFAEAL